MRVGSIKPSGFVLCIIGLLLNSYDLFLAFCIACHVNWTISSIILILFNSVQTLYYVLALAIPGRFFAKKTAAKLTPAYVLFLAGPITIIFTIYDLYDLSGFSQKKIKKSIEIGGSLIISLLKGQSGEESTEELKRLFEEEPPKIEFLESTFFKFSLYVRALSYIWNWIMFIAFANASNPYNCSKFAAPYTLQAEVDIYGDLVTGMDMMQKPQYYSYQ